MTAEPQDRVLVEMDVTTLERLLARKAVTVQELRAVDRKGKRCLKRVFLGLLNRELFAQQ